MRTRALVDVVGPIHSNGVAQITHAAKGDASNIRLREGRLNTGSAGGDAGSQQCEIHELPAIDWERLNIGRVDHLADFRAIGFHRWRFGRYRDGLTYGRYFQGYVQGCCLPDCQGECRLPALAITGSLHDKFIASRQQVRSRVIAGGVCGCCVALIGVQIASAHRGSNDNPASRILNCAAQLSEAECRLAERVGNQTNCFNA